MKPLSRFARRSRGRDLRRARYAEYIASIQWFERRSLWVSEFKQRYPGKQIVCVVCGRNWALKRDDLHHRTYVRLGAEHFSDLWAICRDCHTSLHELLRSNRLWRQLNFEQANMLALNSLRASAGSRGERGK